MKQEQGKKKTYFISGGGTGGHIYPAITIADELIKHEDTEKIFFIGNPNNLEREIVASREGIEFLPVNVAGMPRKFSLGFVKWVFDLEIAIWKCLYYILKYRPNAVFTTGGYVSAPIAFASIILKTPFMIHDCDAHPGLVSQQVAPFAKCVSVAFESSTKILNADKIVCNGNPIRKTFQNLSKDEARASLNLKDKFTVLAMGGSQGAMTINKAMVEASQELAEELDVQVVIQTGRKNYDEVIKLYEQYFPNYIENSNILVQPYFDEMSYPLKAADVVIARAGSVSLSEINACGLPSILVPYPHAAADHQRKNAREMCEKNAALYVEDADCNRDVVLEKIKSLINDPQMLLNMQEASVSLSKSNASENIVNQLKKIIK